MIFIQYKDNREYTFELKSREREVDFCILMNEAIATTAKAFLVTNIHNIQRIIKSREVAKCLYSKDKRSVSDSTRDLQSVMDFYDKQKGE